MNHSHAPTNGYEALEASNTYVTKVGGDNASKLQMNTANALERQQRGKRQIWSFSAMRSVHSRYSPLSDPLVHSQETGEPKPGFNTTSHLIAVAQLLRKGDRSSLLNAESIAKTIGAFIRQLLDAEIRKDHQLQNKEEVTSLLHSCVAMSIDGEDRPQSLLNKIRRWRDPLAIFQTGIDWIMHSDDEYTSITGIGERLAQELYSIYFQARGMPTANVSIEHAYQNIYRNLDRGQDASHVVSHMRTLLQKQITLVLQKGMIAVTGGYLPILGNQRGYSDKTGALLADAAHNEYPDAIYIVEKEFPLMSADPKRVPEAKTIQRMTHFLARELFGDFRGAKGGALHSEALDALSRKGISIVVMNPEVPPAAANTTLIQDFAAEPNGVEIIASKNIPFALQISDSALIGNPEFEADMMRWFHEHGAAVQHIATSEGTVSFTFHEGNYSQALQSALMEHLRDAHQISSPDVVTIQENVSLIYCLGNNMSRPGQASKATTALEFAGVDIHFITQGLNESVMTFLIDAKDSDRAVQMLHDIFVCIDDAEYQRMKELFRTDILRAIQLSHSPLQ